MTTELSRFLGVRAEASRIAIEVGPANRTPSIQNSGLPERTAFESETTFYVYGAEATVNLLDRYGFPLVGLQLTVALWSSFTPPLTDPVRLSDSTQDLILVILLFVLDEVEDVRGNFMYRLDELRLPRVTPFDAVDELLKVDVVGYGHDRCPFG